uniref:Trafficking protein particle complex subunit 6B n=1 Tax=Phallusia mammillata TaxID=59560 RepID=A0A6F9DVR8_9ASCI|nr:trafficking protein particle complex subunit 6B-like [Phallusia mammillata]
MQEDATNVLFELLHDELISYVYSNDIDMKSKQISILESHGFRIGQSLAEQLTKDSSRFKDELEIMKFVCRDFWSAMYQKQVDNLRTNHQGVYVLQDNCFKLLKRISSGKQYLEFAPRFLAIPCGFVRGALANLGINSIVTAEVISMPAVKFQIMIQRV